LIPDEITLLAIENSLSDFDIHLQKDGLSL